MHMLRRLISAVERHGLANVPRLAVKNVIYFLSRARADENDVAASNFDRRFGTDTAETREIGSLDIKSKNARYAVRYQTSPEDIFRAALSSLSVDLERFTLLDFGSGKGRLLLLASGYPLARVVGIEFSSELHEIAQRNIALYRSQDQKCFNVTSVQCDATDFEIPFEPLICYFYNPFGAVVLEEVASNIEQALRHSSRDAYVVYVNPKHKHVFENSSLWMPMRQERDYVVYRAMRDL